MGFGFVALRCGTRLTILTTEQTEQRKEFSDNNFVSMRIGVNPGIRSVIPFIP